MNIFQKVYQSILSLIPFSLRLKIRKVERNVNLFYCTMEKIFKKLGFLSD